MFSGEPLRTIVNVAVPFPNHNVVEEARPNVVKYDHFTIVFVVL
jgi:hypothetical protein